MASGAPERIGYVLEVDDRGTPVVTNFTNRTVDGMNRVENASNKASGSLDGVTRKAAPLATSMEKGRMAAFALSGGISQVGAKASMATAAISQLILVGFNPLGIAIAAASVAIGVLIGRQSEAAEAAKKHADALRGLMEEARALQSERYGKTLGPHAQFALERAQSAQRLRELDSMIRQAEADAMAAAEKLRNERIRSLEYHDPLGLGGSESEIRRLRHLTGDALLQEFNIQAKTNLLMDERTKAQNAIIALEGRHNDLLKSKVDILKRIAGAAFGPWLPGQPPLGPTPGGMGAALRDFDGAGDLAALRAWSYWQSHKAPGDFGMTHRGGAFDLSPPGMDYFAPLDLSGMPDPMDAIRRRNEAAAMARSDAAADASKDLFARMDRMRDIMQAQEQSSPWYISGTRAADGFIAGIGDTLTTGIMTGELDMVTLAESLADLFVRSFIDALLQATLGNALRSAFQTLFMQAGAALGTGGLADPAMHGAAPEGFNYGAGSLVVQPAPVVSEQVLAAAGDEAMRGRVTVAIAGPGRRGRR